MSAPLPAVDYKAIRVALVRACEKATGRTCIISEPIVQNAPRPALPYLTMKITTPGARYGDDYKTNILDGETPTTKWNTGGPRKMTVSFQCFATEQEDAYTLMGIWQAALDLVGIQADLRRAGIAVWLIGTVADLSALLNTGYEGRAQMDVQFGIASNVVEDLGSIEEVIGVGTVTAEDGTHTIDLDVTEE